MKYSNWSKFWWNMFLNYEVDLSPFVCVFIQGYPKGCIRCNFIEVRKVHEEEILIWGRSSTGGTMV